MITGNSLLKGSYIQETAHRADSIVTRLQEIQRRISNLTSLVWIFPLMAVQLVAEVGDRLTNLSDVITSLEVKFLGEVIDCLSEVHT